ncbi:hypothetical protein [Staphylococcus epidermidis]|uniref:hypothetical protein n=1 Tax=Staphylococcus epidermidis TaxID=1282 RepID=UPI000E6779B1|nr:hypothetical protein [Staphylococcus epidermidis]RIL70043.1 hypothetical protein BUY58_00450 [Staphylococcus epidermidis]
MRHKLLKIANDLNKLILHSDEIVKAEFQNLHNGEVGITFWHHSQKYESESGCNYMEFYKFYTDEELKRRFELAKDVIAGECLIDERNSDISN